MGDSDSLVRPRSFSPSNIRTQFRKDAEPAPNPEAAGQETASPDKVDPLPRPERPYKAHARHGNKPELTLHLVTKDYGYEGFSYANLDRVRLVPGQRPGSSPVMILRFSDTEVTIEGRHLHSLYNWIGLHLVPWVWEHPAPAEFADETATLISRISINQIER